MGIRDLAPDWLVPGPSKNPYAGMLSDEAWNYYRRNQLGRNIGRAGDFLTRAAYGDYTGGQRTGGGQNDLMQLMKMHQMLEARQDKDAKRRRERAQDASREALTAGDRYSPTSGVLWNQPPGPGREPEKAPTTAQRMELLSRAYPAAVGTAMVKRDLPEPAKPPTGMRETEEGRLENRPGYVAGQKELAEAKREPANEPFAGNALDAQDSNILLGGDPSSPEYGLAYYRQFQTPKMVMTEQGMVPIIIPAPPGIRPPSAVSAAPATGAPTPATGARAGLPEAPVAIAPVPGTAKRPSDAQQKAASYGVRLQSSNEIITQYEELGAELVGYVSGSDLYPNVLKTSDRQQLEQAQRDFVNAQLRRESGAVIADTEFANAAQQYFPQPGDGPEVIEQKSRAREIAIQNMGKEAGRAVRAAPPATRRAKPQSGDIPRFSNPNDPAFLALPSGSVFYDDKGIMRFKP